MKKGFTLIEMLVVMGILAILIAAGMSSFSSATRKANKARAQELVSNVATALEAIYQKEGCWPRKILAAGASDGQLTAEVAYELAKRGALSLRYDTSNSNKKETIGNDRFGVVTPWAADVIKRMGNKASAGSPVPGGGKISGGNNDHHVLHFAVDTEGNGYVRASVGGEAVTIRGAAAVWCGGQDGHIEPYRTGLRKDDIYSWSAQQRQ